MDSPDICFKSIIGKGLCCLPGIGWLAETLWNLYDFFEGLKINIEIG
jgi:hypothetical protein